MTRFMKVCLIAGGICVLVGGGISLVAASLGGNLWDVMPRKAAVWKNKISGAVFDEFWQNTDNCLDSEHFHYYFSQKDKDMEENGQEIFSSAEIKNMDVTAHTGKIVIAEDPSADKIRIFCNRDESDWVCYAEDDELKVQIKSGRSDSEGENGVLLTIHVPEDYHFSGVDLKSVHADHFSGPDNQVPVILVSSLSADEWNVESKAGSIIVSRGNAGNLSAECDAGAVEYSGTVTGDIDADCKVGGIHMELAGEKKDYNYDITCRLGAVKIGDEDSVALKNNEQVDNGADQDMELDCRTGAIQVDFMNEL